MKKIMTIMAALALVVVSLGAANVELKYSGPSSQGNPIWWAPSSGITNLMMTPTGLKNVKLQAGTLTTNVVRQAGAVTATAVVTPQAPGAVTPTITVTKQIGAITLDITAQYGDTNGLYASITNITIQVIGGDAVMTNATATSSALPDFATNATAAVTVIGGDAVMTNIVVQSP